MLTLLLACSSPKEQPTGPGLAQILAEMTNHDRPAHPLPAVAWQSSSTDPRATDPSGPDWFANNDRGHVLRKDGDRFVLLDRDGPGVLTRLWSANPERGGTLRIFVDHASEPVIEAPMEVIMDRGGPVRPPFASKDGGGSSLHLPIPYGEHLLVTMDENRGKGVYWVAQGLTWTDGRSIRSLDHDDLAIAEIESAAQSLYGSPAHAPDQSPRVHSELAPGERKGLTLTGPAAVRALTVRVSPPEITDLWLEATFDGVPSVEVPLRGLFGTDASSGGYRDFWRSGHIDHDGFVGSLGFTMPFRSGAELTLVNRSERAVAVRMEVAQGELGPGDWLRFRATHRSEAIATRPYSDWTLADWEGPGMLVADTLTVVNPVEAWWGGGDEKIWADGTLLRGTGTEDHYGNAWCSTAVWHGPFGGQARNDRSEITEKTCDHSGGVSTLSRARLLDGVPFQHTLRFDLGVRHREDTTIQYDATVLGYSGLLTP